MEGTHALRARPVPTLRLWQFSLLVLQQAYSCCDATNPNVQMKELYGHQISGMFGALCPAPRIHDLRE